MKRDDTKKNFTSLSGNDLQTVRLHYPSFPCIIAIVPVSRLLNLMRYSSVLNANIRFFCSENRNFTGKFRTPGYFHDLLDQPLPGTVIGMGFACKDELYRIFRIIHNPGKSVYIREQKMSPLICLSLIHI